MALSLQSLLHQILRSDDADWRVRLTKRWSIIVGDLHTRMRIERIQFDTVIIGVYDSHWMHELFALSKVIVTTINADLGDTYVKKIRFVLADTSKKKHKKAVAQSVQNVPQVTMQARHIVALSAIKDAQLHDVLKKFFYRCSP